MVRVERKRERRLIKRGDRTAALGAPEKEIPFSIESTYGKPIR